MLNTSSYESWYIEVVKLCGQEFDFENQLSTKMKKEIFQSYPDPKEASKVAPTVMKQIGIG